MQIYKREQFYCYLFYQLPVGCHIKKNYTQLKDRASIINFHEQKIFAWIKLSDAERGQKVDRKYNASRLHLQEDRKKQLNFEELAYSIVKTDSVTGC